MKVEFLRNTVAEGRTFKEGQVAEMEKDLSEDAAETLRLMGKVRFLPDPAPAPKPTTKRTVKRKRGTS